MNQNRTIHKAQVLSHTHPYQSIRSKTTTTAATPHCQWRPSESPQFLKAQQTGTRAIPDWRAKRRKLVPLSVYWSANRGGGLVQKRHDESGHHPGARNRGWEGRNEEEAGEMARIYNMNERSKVSKTSSAFLALSLPPATVITSPATDWNWASMAGNINELEKRREGPWPDTQLPLSPCLAIAIAMAMPTSLANFEHRGLQTRIHPPISSQWGMSFIGSVGSLFCVSSICHPVTTFFSQTHRILFILRGERVHGEHCHYCTRSSGPAHTSLGAACQLPIGGDPWGNAGNYRTSHPSNIQHKRPWKRDDVGPGLAWMRDVSPWS